MSEPVSPSGDPSTTVRVGEHEPPGIVSEARTERGEVVLNVRFEAEQAPLLAIGVDQELFVESERFSRPIQCAARPIARSQDAQFLTYEFATARDDTRLLGILANRRRCIRVRPDEGAPIQLVLRASKKSPRRPLPVLDISGTGLGVVAPRAVEQELVDTYRVLLELRLPDESDRLEFEARILHRRLRGNYVQYGLEFDPTLDGFASQQDRVFRYVTRREAEEIARRTLASEERRAG